MQAEDVLTRARMRDPVQEFCFFAVTSVTVDRVEKPFSPQKITGRFVKSDGLFNAK